MTKAAVQNMAIVILVILNMYLVKVIFSPQVYCSAMVCTNEENRGAYQYDKLKSRNLCRFIGFELKTDRLEDYVECEPMLRGIYARYIAK